MRALPCDRDCRRWSSWSAAAELHAQLRLRAQASGFVEPDCVRAGSGRSRRAVRRPAGRPHPRRARRRRCSAPTFSTCRRRSSRAASRGCSAWRSRRTRSRAAASSSTSPIDPATPSSRASAGRATAWSPTPRRDSICAGAARRARRSSRSRSRITTAATWRSVPTGFSTSASATADRATIPIIARRIRWSCSARCCASTSTCRTRIRPAIRCRRAIRSSRGVPGGGAAGDLGVRPAQSVALHLRRSRARRHRRAGHRRRRTEPLGGDRLRAGQPRRPQLRLAQSRRRCTTT